MSTLEETIILAEAVGLILAFFALMIILTCTAVKIFDNLKIRRKEGNMNS